ncbi:unnamed protein product [Euphydryas editha]|uniref:Endonuclease/exonuclease/phosphatase domain-containing protein n=1 Tax=Euphydryas editha TaxID=104508 RepID=A0AAU9V0B4_EUPED|nr:unnamed protein product [Euphydryas editha]
MDSTTQTTAPSSQRPLNGTGVLRIPGWKHKKETFRIGTWNARGMRRDGKVENIAIEMARLNIDVLGISDTKIPGTGKIHTVRNCIVYYSGSDCSKERYGVAIAVSQRIEPAITNVIPISNRAMMLQINTKPRKLNVIQVYAPTADKDTAVVNDFYADVNKLYQLTKKEEINVVMGDLNARVGSGEVPGTVGKFGLGARNERGDLLVQFCQEKELVIANTLFQLPPRRLYTWTSPAHMKDNIVRNQIDYVMLNKRFRNSIKCAKTYPGADIGSDHHPVIVDLSCQLKYILKSKSQSKVAQHYKSNDELVPLPRTQWET